MATIGTVNVVSGVVQVKSTALLDKGFSYYNQVVIFWDEDYDSRVFEAVNKLNCANDEHSYVVAVSEHEGLIEVYWNQLPTSDLLLDTLEVNGDCWSVSHIDMSSHEMPV